MILENDSSLQLNWRVGDDSGSIAPWNTNVIILGAAAGQGAGISQVNITTSGFGSGELIVTWSNDGDEIPASYPSTTGVAASAIAAQALILLGTFDLAAKGAFTVETTVACPPGALGLISVWPNYPAVNAIIDYEINGNTTGVDYAGAAVDSPSVAPILFSPYNSQLDPLLTISGVLTAAGAGVLSVYAMFPSPGSLPSMSQAGTLAPGWATLIAGRAATTLGGSPVGVAKPLLVDLDGAVLLGDPNVNAGGIPLVATMAAVAATTTNIAAPASGSWYLFHGDLINSGATECAVEIQAPTGTTVGFLGTTAAAAAGATDHTDMDRFRVGTGAAFTLDFVVAGTSPTCILRYAPGP